MCSECVAQTTKNTFSMKSYVPETVNNNNEVELERHAVRWRMTFAIYVRIPATAMAIVYMELHKRRLIKRDEARNGKLDSLRNHVASWLSVSPFARHDQYTRTDLPQICDKSYGNAKISKSQFHFVLCLSERILIRVSLWLNRTNHTRSMEYKG